MWPEIGDHTGDKGKEVTLPLERREDSRVIRDNLITRIIQFKQVQLVWVIGLMLIFHL